MINKKLAELIHEAIVTDKTEPYLVNTIETVLNKYNPEKAWQRLALDGKREEAIRTLWADLADDKNRNIDNVFDCVDMYMSTFR